jgi:hypothetical protein
VRPATLVLDFTSDFARALSVNAISAATNILPVLCLILNLFFATALLSCDLLEIVTGTLCKRRAVLWLG